MEKSWPWVFIFAAFILFLGGISEAGNPSEPGDSTDKGIFSLERIFSGVVGEISDGVGGRSDFPSCRGDSFFTYPQKIEILPGRN